MRIASILLLALLTVPIRAEQVSVEQINPDPDTAADRINAPQVNRRPSSPDRRPAPAVPLVGLDKCDQLVAESQVGICAHPIESRAADYRHPPPSSLVKERLLAEQAANVANASPPENRRAGDRDAETFAILGIPPVADASPTPR